MLKYLAMAVLAIFMCTQIGWTYQPSQEYVSVSVMPGQTVWQLARAVTDEKTDVREVVQAIMEENHLSGNSDIRPGQILRLPVAAGQAEHARTVLAKQLVRQ